LDTPSAEAALTEAGLDPSAPLMVSALSSDESELYDNELHHRLCDLAVPHMLLADQCVQVLLPGVDDVIANLALAVKGLPLVAGVSHFHTGVNSWPVARKEAIWALEQGMPARDGDQVQRFSPSESHAHWLPTDIDTLEGLVNGILAPVIEYDRKHNSDLLLTLRAFFQHDRSVKSAAAELYVHKHTLAYRLNRIEDITGRNLSSTADIAQLWLALQALEIVGPHPNES
jgi:purine catabolism regulator